MFPKVSILIPAFNQLEYTKGCINSLLATMSQVRTPYEIIVCDNASTDGTKEYLDKLAESGLIKVIHNTENAGFPKATNQMAALARGEYLCLLNNDTVLTKDWIEKLLRCIRSDNQVAAVGPYTNHSSGHQQVYPAPGYKGAEDLKVYAEKFTGEEKYVDFLVFFCCLIKRKVWDEIGGLWEGYNLGNFDDNEFCYRILEKGYKMKICGNCYIHHYSGRSFRKDKEAEEKYIQLLIRNQKLFLRRINRYETVGLSMIVSDQESPETFRKCLRSIAPVMDSINVVFNYKDYPKPWRLKKLVKELTEYEVNIGSVNYTYTQFKDFGDARNQSLRMNSERYCVWVDCDDTCQHMLGIRDVIFKNPHIQVFKCRILSMTEHNTVETIMHNRIFKNDPRLIFKNRCHEDISYSFDELGYKFCFTDITFNHWGYINPKHWYKKNQRNYELIMQDIAECKDKPEEQGRMSLLYYGIVNSLVILAGGQQNLKEKDATLVKALLMCDDCLKLLKPEDPLTAKMYVLRGIVCLDAGQQLAAKQSFHKAYDEWLQPEGAVNLAEIYLKEENWNKAIEILDKTQEKFQGNYPMSGLSYDPVQIHTLLLEKLGHAWERKSQEYKDKPEAFESAMRKAEQYYRACVNLRPKVEIVNILMQILRNTNRLDEATAMARKAVNKWPGYFMGWLVLADYELLHGVRETAKVFYRQVLRLKPGQKEALHNLQELEEGNDE